MSEAYDLVNAFQDSVEGTKAIKQSFEGPQSLQEMPEESAAQTRVRTKGYVSDPDFEHHDYGLYSKGGKATLIFRATDPTKLNDIGADFEIALGRENHSKRFRGAEDAYSRAVQKYGEGNVDVAGFSLGGSQAMYISDKYGAKATVFNPGISPADVDNNYQNPRNYKNVKAYITVGDSISNHGLMMPNLNTKAIYATDIYKDVAKSFGPGAVGSAIKTPVTPLQAVETGIMQNLRRYAPALGPYGEAAFGLIKGVGALGILGKNAVKAHSLDSMGKYFEDHKDVVPAPTQEPVKVPSKPKEVKPTVPEVIPPVAVVKAPPKPPEPVAPTISKGRRKIGKASRSTTYTVYHAPRYYDQTIHHRPRAGK